MKRFVIFFILIPLLFELGGITTFSLAAIVGQEDLTTIRKQAEAGDMESQFKLGRSYYQKKQYVESAEWFRKAGEKGHAQAQFYLGYQYEKGQGVSVDPANAVKWYKKAADQGIAGAQNNLGLMYKKGLGVDKDIEEGVRWILKSAENGDRNAQYSVSNSYEKGEGVERNKGKAVFWLKKAAENGYPQAQFELFERYVKADGVSQDYEEAFKWLKAAAENGYLSAQSDLGAAYHLGYWGAPHDEELAFKWTKKAADGGSKNAIYNIGLFYLSGTDFVAKDSIEAYKWIQSAAEKGHLGSQSLLGATYFDAKQYENALPWLQKSSNSETGRSQYCLGVMYEKGWGVSRDTEKARDWYRKAAEKDFLDAKQRLNNLSSITTVGVSFDYTSDEPSYSYSTSASRKEWEIGGAKLVMVYVPGGDFLMGATEGQGSLLLFSKPVHSVSLSGFWIGQTEVTQDLWIEVMGYNPSSYDFGGRIPVDSISWSECMLFIKKLNELTGQHFRLPTEAEWEYAARGGVNGKDTMFSGSDDDEEVAWHLDNNSTNLPHQVATKKPNGLGLYDMSGNVWEFCSDRYGDYSEEHQNNPKGPGPEKGSYRVIRGGCHRSPARDCRVSDRQSFSEDLPGSPFIGFRLAL